MLFLLHVQDRPVLEGPLHDVCFRRGALDVVGSGELGPELVEVLQLYHVPDLGEGGGDDGGFGEGGGGGDAGGHVCGLFFFLGVFVGWVLLVAVGGVGFGDWDLWMG